jgi:hypothetical protein
MRFLLLFLFLQAELFCATFHAVVIADTFGQDVRHSTTIDVKRMRHAMRRFAKGCKYKLKLTVLDDTRMTVENLERWYAKSHVRKKDIVFFYFTGHGFSSRQHQSIWPDLLFKPNMEVISMERVHEVLRSKRARLTVLLSDSCNKLGPFAPAHRAFRTKKNAAVPIMFAPKRRGIKKLFRSKRGRVLASGAVPGTVSFGSTYGGYFTQGFLIAFQEESHKKRPSWKRIFRRTQALLQSAQKPQYKLFLK